MKNLCASVRLWIGLVLLSPTVHGQEIHVVSEEFPPYNYTKNGQFSGVSTDVVTAAFKELGIEFEVKVYPWARAYKSALEQANTLIFSIGRNEKREELFHWVGIIAPAKSYLFALRSRNDISVASLEDAKKYRIGTVLDDVREQYLLARGFAKNKNIYYSNSYETNFKLLLKGRIDLWRMAELSAYHIARKNGLEPQAMLKKAYFLQEVSQNGYYMAFSKQTPLDVVKRFEVALQAVKNKGIYQRIQDEYFH